LKFEEFEDEFVLKLRGQKSNDDNCSVKSPPPAKFSLDLYKRS